MITNITLENFKCFRQVSIDPKLLTVLIGPNGTGKSSILQALLLWKQTLRRNSNRPVYAGEFVHLIGESEIAPNFIQDSPGLSLSFQVSGRKDNEEIRQALDKMRFVPAIRGLTQPTYDLGELFVEYLSLKEGFDAQEVQLATNLVYGSSDIEKLSNMLERVTGVRLQVDPIPGRQIAVKSHIAKGQVNLIGEGFGTNSLIQLFHQIIIAQPGSTVLIEEPEIHLHPKAQADLAEVMAETARAEDKQIIMTTHSEHIAGRLLTLVAEGKLTTDDLAIYSFEKDDKGECTARELVVTELGQTEGGLTGFFDNNLAEMDRYVKALQNRS